MNVYLVAGADQDYDASAYGFIVGNGVTKTNRKYGWTVVEAFLNGLVEASNYVIKTKLYEKTNKFTVCTSSSYISKLLTTDLLDEYQLTGWSSRPGVYIFHEQLLKQIYYQQLYFKERAIEWDVMKEVTEMEYRLFERCQNDMKKLLEE